MSISNIPRFLGIRPRSKVGTRGSYGVTPYGKEKFEKMDMSGPRYKVLGHLAEEGPSTFSEIIRETGLDADKVKLILKGLMDDGYVVPTGQTA